MIGTNTLLYSLKDIAESIARWRVWVLMGTADIRARYARAVFGQMWQTLSLLMMMGGMAVVYSNILKIEWRDYIAYLCCAYVAWSFISGMFVDSTGTFLQSEAYLKNYESPIFMFPMKAVLRGLVVLGHNLVATLIILFAVGKGINFSILLFLPALVVYSIIGANIGVIFGYLGARYRDAVPLVTNLMQIVFFVTPVMWPPEKASGGFRAVLPYNPFEQMLAIGRDPLRGIVPSLLSWEVSCVIALGTFIVALLCVGMIRRKVVYWL